MDEKQNGGESVVRSGSFAARFDNFWYHYKWHTIITLFVAFVIIVCAVQCAGNTKYDIQILYAGNYSFDRSSSDGGYPEYMVTVSSLCEFAKDYDENGEVSLSFCDLYLLTQEEVAEIESNNGTVSIHLLQENTTTLRYNLDTSDSYVCFLSERLFRQYSEGESNRGRFMEIADYTVEGREYDFVSEYGIRLSSLDAKDMPGISSLDAEDTIVCIRKISAMSNMSRKLESKKQFARSEDFLRNLLSYTKNQ